MSEQQNRQQKPDAPPPVTVRVATEADDYAGLTEEQRAEFAEQVGHIDGLRILEIVRRTVVGQNTEPERETE